MGNASARASGTIGREIRFYYQMTEYVSPVHVDLLVIEQKKKAKVPPELATAKAVGKLGHSLNTFHRPVAMMAAQLTAIGVISNETGDVLDAVFRALMINQAVWAIYQGYLGLLALMRSMETAQAGILTGVHLAFGDVVGIALAAAAAAATYAGLQIATGEWTLPGFDMNNHVAMRQSIAAAKTVNA